MNLESIRPKNGTEDLLLSITKNCEANIRQVHRKAEETLEIRLTEPRKTLSFEPFINLGGDFKWMVGLTSLEVYNSSLK